MCPPVDLSETDGTTGVMVVAVNRTTVGANEAVVVVAVDTVTTEDELLPLL